MSVREHEVAALFEALFSGPGEQEVMHLLPVSGERPVAVIDGSLYELKMETASGDPVAVRLYLSIGDVGGQLWTHEVRAMLRFSVARHSGLPRLHDGGVRRLPCPDGSTRQVAFTVVDREGSDLGDPALARIVSQQRRPAVRQFAMLADALRLLHGSGLSHRALQPHAIEFIREAHDQFRLRLARFETSALEASLLRRTFSEDGETGVQRDLVFDTAHGLACVPPERLQALFPDGALLVPPDLQTGDVFGLGMLAFGWFAGDLDPAKLEAAFPRAPGGRLGFDRAAHRALLTWVRSRLATASTLPPVMRDLLGSMLRDSPFTRPTAHEVVDTLARHYDGLGDWYASEEERRPFLVAIMPEEFRRTAYEWGWIPDDPATPEGLAALRTWITEDLRGGVIEYHRGGWAEMSGNRHDAEEQRADLVLHGKRGGYFGHLFEFRLAHEGRNQGVLVPQVFIIRHVLDFESPLARRYRRSPFHRRLPPLEVLSWRSRRVTPAEATQRPSWAPLADSVRVEVARPDAHRDFEQALGFFLDLQQVELDARQYAFRRDGLPSGDEATLVYDADTDERRRLTRELLHRFAASTERRPPFGDFFAGLGEAGTAFVTFRPAGTNGPSLDRDLEGKAIVVRWEGTLRIRIRRVDGEAIPPSGWLEPADDKPARVVLDRQRRATRELLNHPALLDKLINPWSLFEPSRMCRTAAEAVQFERRTERDGTVVTEMVTLPRLRGRRSRRAVQELLASTPFYAMQGPPGTGKTTLAARAVRAALVRDPSMRILVSAQSHFALDNFAARVLEYLPSEPEVLPLRVASASTEERVDAVVAPYLARHVADRTLTSIDRRCRDRLRRGGDSPPLRSLVQLWRNGVERLLPEIVDRVRRGSNVVFSTCGSATEDEVGTRAGIGEYDWVVIEEAAKAWPTELAIPLVRGQQWSLIGDHRQLSAYRLREVSELLEETLPATPAGAAARESYLRFFNLFASFFRIPRVAEGDRDGGGPDDDIPRLIRPTTTLNLQFRMAPAIAEIVSCFYDEPLQPGPGVDAPHDVSMFEGKSLVWVDTGEEAEHRCEPWWFNEGEVHTVEDLLAAMRPFAAHRDEKAREGRLSILSPYNDQVKALQRGLPSEFRTRVHTIDSFQGREAEIVCVSLVRRRGGHMGTAATSRLGHLVDPQRANVLLSRARRLLVLVGDLRHFEVPALDQGEARAAFWPRICAAVRRAGIVISAAEVRVRGRRSAQ